jgi:hypothetical protein
MSVRRSEHIVCDTTVVQEGQHRSYKGGSTKIEACESQEERALVQLKP